MNHTWSSFRRRTSLISRSFEPQSWFLSVLLIALRTFSIDDLVGVEQAMDHRRDLLRAVWRPLDRRQLSRVTGVANGDPAQALHPLRQQVDQLCCSSACLSNRRWSW